MKKTTVCTIINLTLIGIVWLLIVGLPNLIVGRVLAWWINILLAVIGLITSGYFVQYILSPIVNRAVMGNRNKNE